ncbi:MAG: ferrous iron transport protein B [Methanobacteriota archaeon]
MGHGRPIIKGNGQGCDLTVALVGNANVGKSAIYNQLTGSEQAVGNWGGKTVEMAEGVLNHDGRLVRVVDLPGTYSLSSGSAEESVTRDYILAERPDVIINVVDSTALERNLFLTIQLIEMGVPVVLAANMTDAASAKGLTIDAEALSRRLGVPVVKVAATSGVGLHELVDNAIGGSVKVSARPRYGPEVEARISRLEEVLRPERAEDARRMAVSLLEGAEFGLSEIENRAYDEAAAELERIHGEPAGVVIASERYALAASMANEAQSFAPVRSQPLADKIDRTLMHGFWGYIWLFVIMAAIIASISIVGGWASDGLAALFEGMNPGWAGWAGELAWSGGIVGLYSALGVALGFLLPFYLLLGFLEDVGYLPRIGYLMDRPCHIVGLHGKACMPLMLGFGCNVPACAGCRIIENRRDRIITTFLSSLVPCSARTAVVLGLVGMYLGVEWAIFLYALDFLIILGVGRFLNWLMPGSSPGMIMEIPSFRMPKASIVASQAWAKFRPFLTMAVPLIVAGSVVIEGLRIAGYLGSIADVMSPVTVAWLGLPAFTGILLIVGILRKEAALVFLSAVAGTTAFATVMTPLQIFIFSFVIMVYIPCISTIAVIYKDLGLKWAAAISLAEVGLALALGGILARVLAPVL